MSKASSPRVGMLYYERILGLIHEPFLQTNLFLSPTYEDFTKIVAVMNFFLSRTNPTNTQEYSYAHYSWHGCVFFSFVVQ